MKNRILILSITMIIAISGVIYGFTSTSNTENPGEATTEAVSLESCPLAGTPDCPLIQNCPDKGTAKSP